ncbi:uncharacterized protein LOC124493756 [Dermatophagoides farinae]|uniref:uncharacterized protein LOC124493756 n=1 Tax=Dermatophagoides farinae TaxID=6954 RepID=UPI003F6057CC
MYYNHPPPQQQQQQQPVNQSSSNQSDDHRHHHHQNQIFHQASYHQDPYTFYPFSFFPKDVDIDDDVDDVDGRPNTFVDNQQQSQYQQHQQQLEKIDIVGHPTTLYQNRSVSIINCEYKLKEKYPHLITLIFFFVIYITIILLGASLFMAFESKAEQRLRDQIMNKQQLFLEQNQCVDSKELKQFIKSVIITYDKGVNLALLNDLVDSMMMTTMTVADSDGDETDKMLAGNKNVSKVIVIDKRTDDSNDDVIEEIIVTERKQQQPSLKSYPTEQQQQLEEQQQKEGQRVKASTLIVPIQMSNWEFGSSMTYVASVVTTIGYGHVTPITNEGKILTIVFGAISIPCTLLFLSIIISMIRDGPIKQIEVWLIKLFGYFTEEVTLLKIRFLHLFLVTMVLFSALIILPAFLFKQMEPQWTFLDSFYYCFITITTVGLGDYVPGQNGLTENRTWYLISIVVYMYFGLCLMMLWIALVLRIPYFNFKTFLVIEEPELLERKLINEQIRNCQQHSIINSSDNDHDDDDDEKSTINNIDIITTIIFINGNINISIIIIVIIIIIDINE